MRAVTPVFAVLGAGGLGVGLWSSGIFSGPYGYIGRNTSGTEGSELICGRYRGKYDCKLSMSLARSAGGGGQAQTIKTTDIKDILKAKGEERAPVTLYLFDKNTSTTGYILRGQGPFGELKITTEDKDGPKRPIVQVCQENTNCSGGTANCCKTSGHKGHKLDDKFEKLLESLSTSSIKTPKVKNILGKLSYLR